MLSREISGNGSRSSTKEKVPENEISTNQYDGDDKATMYLTPPPGKIQIPALDFIA
jgi:hypothetical protein